MVAATIDEPASRSLLGCFRCSTVAGSFRFPSAHQRGLHYLLAGQDVITALHRMDQHAALRRGGEVLDAPYQLELRILRCGDETADVKVQVALCPNLIAVVCHAPLFGSE